MSNKFNLTQFVDSRDNKKVNRIPIGPKQRFEIFKRDSFTCHYCGRKAPSITLQLDHIIPVAKGGDNSSDNLLTSCEECNRGKSISDVVYELDSTTSMPEMVSTFYSFLNQLPKSELPPMLKCAYTINLKSDDVSMALIAAFKDIFYTDPRMRAKFLKRGKNYEVYTQNETDILKCWEESIDPLVRISAILAFHFNWAINRPPSGCYGGV